MRANWLTLLLLEGMAANQHTRALKEVSEDLLEWLKSELRRLFGDVLTSVDRESAKEVVKKEPKVRDAAKRKRASKS